MALLGGQQKLIVVLVLFVAVFALILGVFIGHSFLIVPPNTQTQTWNWYAFQGSGALPDNQLLDASSYATSWSYNSGSEKVVMQGGVSRGFGALSCVVAWQYQVWTSADGVSWTQVPGSPFVVPIGNAIAGAVTAPSYPYVYYGPFSGALKADFQVHVMDVTGPGCTGGIDRGFLTVAEDEAYLVNSAFTLSADQQGQIGQTVHATVGVGYLTTKAGGPGWQLWAFSTAQNKVVLGPISSGTSQWNQSQQSFAYTITNADFSSTAGTCGNGNRIEWHLLNEIWPRAWQYTTTIDVSSFAPSFTFDGWSGANVENGSVLLKFHGTPNPTTASPITRLVLSYGYGTAQVQNLTANTTQQTIQLGQNGLLHIEGYSIDAACRPSKPARLDINVYPRGQQPPGNGPPNWLVFFGILVAFAAVGAVVAYLAKGPLWGRFLVFAVVFVAGVLIAVIAEPNVLNPLTWAAGAVPGWWRWR